MRSTLLGLLQTATVIGGVVAFGLAYASCATPHPHDVVVDCLNTHDQWECEVTQPDAVCGTDTECEEWDSWMDSHSPIQQAL